MPVFNGPNLAASREAAVSVLGEQDNSTFGNVLRFLSRPMYAVHSAITGDIEGTLRNIGQMALDLPTGGFLNRNLSLANLVDDDGDITNKDQRPEFSDVTYRWGLTSHPEYLTAGERVALDLGGIFTDPLTYMGGVGLGKGLAAGAVKGGRQVAREVLHGAFNATRSGRLALAGETRRAIETAAGKIDRLAQAATPEIATQLTSSPYYVGLRNVLDNTAATDVLTQERIGGLFRGLATNDAEARALGDQLAGLRHKAAENLFFEAAAEAAPYAPDRALLQPNGVWALRNWRDFANSHADDAVAMLERKRLLINPREMVFRIPGTDIQTPFGISNFWSRVGRYGTAPGWARGLLHRLSPDWGHAADAAVTLALDDVYAKFFNRTAKYSHLLPQSMIDATNRFRAENIGADRVFARRLQQFGSDAIDPQTGRPRGVTDPMAEAAGDELGKAEDVHYRTFHPNLIERADGTTLDLNQVHADVEGYRSTSNVSDLNFFRSQALRFLYPGRTRVSSSAYGKTLQALSFDIDMAHVERNVPRLANDEMVQQALATGDLHYIDFDIPQRGVNRLSPAAPPTSRERRIYFRHDPKTKGLTIARKQAEQFRDDLLLLANNDRFLPELTISDQAHAAAAHIHPQQPGTVTLLLGEPVLTPRQRQAAIRANPSQPIVSGPLDHAEAIQAIQDDLARRGFNVPTYSRVRLDVDATSRGNVRRVGTPSLVDHQASAELLDAFVRVGRRSGAAPTDSLALFHALTPDHVLSAEDFWLAIERDMARTLDPQAFARQERRNARGIGPRDQSADLMFRNNPNTRRLRERILRTIRSKVDARARAMKGARQRQIRGRLIENVARRWAALPEHGLMNEAYPRALAHLHSMPPAVRAGLDQDKALEGLIQTHMRRLTNEFLSRPDGVRVVRLAANLMGSVLDDFQKIPREMVALGRWPSSLPANPFYMPHQLSPLFQDVVRRAMGHPEFEGHLDRLLSGLHAPGLTIGDTFSRRRRFATGEEFRAHADSVLQNRLSRGQNIEQVIGADAPAEVVADLQTELADALRDLGRQFGVDMDGIELLQEKNILKLWRARMMAHHRTVFRAKTTREALRTLGLRPTRRLGATTQNSTGIRLEGESTGAAREAANRHLNPVLRDYLQFQFEPLGQRTQWLQRVLGGGKFRIPVPHGSEEFFRKWTERSRDGHGFFSAQLVNPRREGNGRVFVEFDWPGLNYFWKPALTSVAVPVPFTKGKGSVPLNPAYHSRNTLGMLFMGMTDPDMAKGVRGIYDNVKAVLSTMWDSYIVRFFGKDPQLEGDLAPFLRLVGDDLDAALEAERVLRASPNMIGNYTMSQVVDLVGQAFGQRIPTSDTTRIAMTRTDIALGFANLDHYGRQIANNGPWVKRAVNRIVQLGTGTAEYAETRLRINGLLTLLDKGVEAQEAVRRVNHAFVDYSVNSSVELLLRDYIPFAKWTLGATKWVKDVANRPVLVNWMGRIRSSGEDAFLPERAEDSLALPLPWRDKEGNMQFLLSLGLPLETTLNIVGAPASPQTFRRQVLGGLQPALKLPAEAVAGRNFFFGDEFGNFRRAPRWLPKALTREVTLPDGSKRYEVSPMINEALSTMPYTRLNSMANTIFDERRSSINKAFNILTGVRTMSVDQEREFKLRLMDYLRDSAKRGLAGERLIYFERGFKPEDMPEDLRIIMSTLHSIESEERKARRRQGGVLRPRLE